MSDPILMKTIEELDEFTRQQLFALNQDLQEEFKKYQRGKMLNDSPTMLRNFEKFIFKWGGLFAAGLLSYNVLAAKRSLKQNNDILRDEFDKYATNKKSYQFLDAAESKVIKNVSENFLSRKFPGTNKNTEQRLKTVIDGAQQTVRNIVNDGIKSGTSSWDIAKQIEAYVIPNEKGLRVAPWTVARRELGKPVSYIPKGIPAGSVEYNAMRIARTETVSTYQMAPYLENKDKWYYNGTKWVLSKSHPEYDICDEYAAHNEGIGKGVWKICPKIPHPHCMCHTLSLTVPPEEMLEMFEKLDW